MKRSVTLTAALRIGGVALLAIGSLPTRSSAQYPTKPPASAPLKPASLPPFQEALLTNGVRVVLVEDHRSPVVAFRLALPAGSVHDPKGKTGLASMVAGLLTKGAGSSSAEQIAETIERAGGSLVAFTENDFLSVTGNVLSNATPLAFELLGDVIARPAFSAKEVDLVRTQTLSSLQLDAADPASVASRFFTAGLYGAHPYGASATPSTVRAITAADLKTFQTARLRPRGAVLVVAGDITMPVLKQLSEKAFTGWTGAPAAAAVVAPAPARSKSEIVLVHRPGSVQSNVLIGNLAMGPADSARLAASLAVNILGGGADGRLFTILREQKSWTYGAYAQLTRVRGIGYFFASTEVRTEVTDSALIEAIAQIKRITTEPIPVQEFERKKGSIVGSFPLSIETPQQLAERVASVKLYGLPANYLQTYRTKMSAVTPAQAQAAARRVMRPSAALVVVVGDGAKLYDKLARIATVRIVNVDGDVMQPGDLTPKAMTLALDFSKLSARRDSFVVFVQGNPLGSSVYVLEQRDGGWTYGEKTNVMNGMIAQETSLQTDGALAPQRLSQSASMQGQKTQTTIDFANGRAKGTAGVPSQTGPTTKAIDVEMPAGTLMSEGLQAAIPLFRWADGATFTVNLFSSGKGIVQPVTLTVVASESVTVPAGTFDTWKVEQKGGESTVVLYVSKDAARRIVKIAPVGQPIELRLAK